MLPVIIHIYSIRWFDSGADTQVWYAAVQNSRASTGLTRMKTFNLKQTAVMTQLRWLYSGDTVLTFDRMKTQLSFVMITQHAAINYSCNPTEQKHVPSHWFCISSCQLVSTQCCHVRERSHWAKLTYGNYRGAAWNVKLAQVSPTVERTRPKMPNWQMLWPSGPLVPNVTWRYCGARCTVEVS